jgi:hypothetical protein
LDRRYLLISLVVNKLIVLKFHQLALQLRVLLHLHLLSQLKVSYFFLIPLKFFHFKHFLCGHVGTTTCHEFNLPDFLLLIFLDLVGLHLFLKLLEQQVTALLLSSNLSIADLLFSLDPPPEVLLLNHLLLFDFVFLILVALNGLFHGTLHVVHI